MKHYLPVVEFYITNVCQLNCEHCDRFNNYYFSGQQKWSDYSKTYKRWGELLDLDRICILGGEPLLNPSINEWIDGLASIWNKSEIFLSTNGINLNKVDGLYRTIKQHKGRVWIDVSIHNDEDIDTILETVSTFMSNPQIPPDAKEVLMRKEDKRLILVDDNQIKIVLTRINYFHRTSLIENDGKFKFHNSNPQKAINVCVGKDCHQMKEGRLYKCYITSNMLDFYNQFNFDITTEDEELIKGYTPLTVNSSNKEFDTFIADLHLNKPEPQCKFCPENIDINVFNASRDKKRVPKK